MAMKMGKPFGIDGDAGWQLSLIDLQALPIPVL
jgi:hypothetical protein